MAAAVTALESEGWHVQPQTLLALLTARAPSADVTPDLHPSESVPLSAQQVQAAALDLDLRRFGKGWLPDDVNRVEHRQLQGNFVLQVVSAVKVCEPRGGDDAESAAAAADEDGVWEGDEGEEGKGGAAVTAGRGVHDGRSAAFHSGAADSSNGGGSGGRRLLRVRVTDGKRNASALEVLPCPHLPAAIAPGTKLRVTNPEVRRGFIMLHPSCVTLLGGRVSPLYEEWDLHRRYSLLPALTPTHPSSHSSRTTSLSASSSSPLPPASDGPPPFRGVTDVRHSEARRTEARLQAPLAAASVPEASGTAGPSGHGVAAQAPGREVVSGAGAAGAAPAAAAAATAAPVAAREAREGEGESAKVGEAAAAAEAARGRAVERARAEAAAAAALLHAAPHDRSASRKLLERKVEEEGRGRGRRGGRGRGRGRRWGGEEEDEGTMTLEEWEARKAVGRQGAGGMGGMGGVGGSMEATSSAQVMSDEELARKLQAELDMEDMGWQPHALHMPPHAHPAPASATSASEQLRQSLFSYQPAAEPERYEGGRGRGRRGRRGGGGSGGRARGGRSGGRGGW